MLSWKFCAGPTVSSTEIPSVVKSTVASLSIMVNTWLEVPPMNRPAVVPLMVKVIVSSASAVGSSVMFIVKLTPVELFGTGTVITPNERGGVVV